MYHIPEDRRAARSAELILGGLLSIKGRTIADITVTDIVKAAGVGRSTFYRLFDNSVDVLMWKSDEIMKSALSASAEMSSFDEIFLSFISSWMEEKALLGALVRSSLTDILFEVHLAHIDEINTLFFRGAELSPLQQEYLVTLLSAMMASGFRLWETRGFPSPEEMLSSFREALFNLGIMFGAPPSLTH